MKPLSRLREGMHVLRTFLDDGAKARLLHALDRDFTAFEAMVAGRR